jgi:hypothetical protein
MVLWPIFFKKTAKLRQAALVGLRVSLLGVCTLLPAVGGEGQCLPEVKRFQGYSFLNPLLIDPALPGAPYVLDFETLYNRYGRQDRLQTDENIAEWRARFCDIPLEEDVRSLIYGYDADFLADMRLSATLPNVPLNPDLRQNTFARYLVRHKCVETIDYLIFAKNCEDYVTHSKDPWETKQGPNRALSMDRLIDQGLKIFLRTKSDYIRLRYAYQIIRLAHYSKQYERTLELFDYLMPKIDHDPSKIEFWILGHKAGALLQTGKPVEASYLYARVFLNSPGKRESAFRSFHIRSDEEWKQCMLLCQDDQERATLYAMRAYMRDSKALEEMEAIYQLDPASPYLEVLLAREIRRLERHLLGLEFNDKRDKNKRYFGLPSAEARYELVGLQAFVRNVNARGQTPNQALWILGQGYLEFLAGDTYAARKSFLQAKDITDDPVLDEQIEALNLANQISAFQFPSEEVDELAAEAKLDNPLFSRYPSFPDFLEDKMSWLYEKFKRPGKAFLVRYDMGQLKANPKPELLDDLQQLAAQSDLTRYERDLLRKTKGADLQNDLIDLKATQFFNEGNVAAALETYKQMDRANWNAYGLYSPFVERFTECIHCRPRDTSGIINKGQLFEKLLDLEYQALANREQGGRYFYQLGLAYYNMSYFGHAWRIRDYFRSGSSLKRAKSARDPDLVPDPRFPFGNREYFDCSKAMEYFELARRTSPDPELSAKAVFMAARCEQNAYFAKRAPRTYQYFDVLNRYYFNTRFYKIIVQECKYFQTYAAK